MDAILNGIVFLVSVSDFSLLVFRSRNDFCDDLAFCSFTGLVKRFSVSVPTELGQLWAGRLLLLPFPGGCRLYLPSGWAL